MGPFGAQGLGQRAHGCGPKGTPRPPTAPRPDPWRPPGPDRTQFKPKGRVVGPRCRVLGTIWARRTWRQKRKTHVGVWDSSDASQNRFGDPETILTINDRPGEIRDRKGGTAELFRTSSFVTYSCSTKFTKHLDHISHCRITFGTN